MADQKTPLEDLLTAAVIGGGFNILQQFPVVGVFLFFFEEAFNKNN